MKVQKAEFRAAATTPSSIPPARLPEVAVAGRSNVGKSSLLNRLTGRKSLARTSRTPGCTRGLMFFDLNDRLTIVDLPGYGYASRSKTERQAWKKLVEHYLSSREELAGVLILADVRRGPEEEEVELAAYLDSVGLPWALVLTKVDKLKRSALAQQTAKLRKAVAPAIVLPTSSETGTGMDLVWRWIRAAIETDAAQQEPGTGPESEPESDAAEPEPAHPPEADPEDTQ
jgi:GTP-binding protein